MNPNPMTRKKESRWRALIKNTICLFLGHPCLETGRRGLVIREQYCTRCGYYFVSSDDPYHGKSLISMNERFEEFLKPKDSK